ncbi:hypothetical protein X797_000806 [Metarhizium robertsii]|uniref:Uncharacterized protein n=1 Tax=Metarhizium robertsii TaxID=568076 RepID=A0A0A1V7A7_9HYPO|nr:hypothetical protein X797_000806 [Metarhizium robertsii]
MKIVKDAELFDYICTSQIDEETFHFLGFKFLHRLNIVRIQNDLIVTREHISPDMTNILTFPPTTALRNYDYVHEARLLLMKPLSDGNNTSKFKFPVTTIHHHTRPFESHYYYLHDNAKHVAVDALCNKLRHWISPRLS